MRVMIIEEDDRRASLMEEALKLIGCESECASDLETGYLELVAGEYQAAVLEGAALRSEATAFIKRARREDVQTPVLYLAGENGPEEKVQALEAGADYALSMPFSMEEFLAVVKSLLRRQGSWNDHVLSVGDLTLDTGGCLLIGPQGTVSLGKKEFDVLTVLMRNRGQVISKETILKKVWGDASEAVENNVEIYISFLRKKILMLKAHVMISTLRGLGYRLLEMPDTQKVKNANERPV